MIAAIISIGDELTNGFTIDTNSSWISQNLIQHNIQTIKKIVVQDNKQDIIDAINHMILMNPTFLFITGGLGPTNDDITKEAIKELIDDKYCFSEKYYQKLKKFFIINNLRFSELHKSQAMLLKKVNHLENTCGTALGMKFQYKSTLIFSIPGVPIEMKNMFKYQIKNQLPNKIKDAFITINSCGISESRLHDKISDVMKIYNNKIKFSFLPSYTGVSLRISKLIDNSVSLNDIKDQIEKLIIPYNYSYGNESLEMHISKLLLKRNITLSAAESCTGGLLSKKLTDLSNSSKFFMGSIVAYNNSIKEKFLNIPSIVIKKHGAVSSEIAELMAKNIKKTMKTDIGLGITGISGPLGSADKKPIGLVYISILYKDDMKTKKFNLIPDRKIHRIQSVQMALNMLRISIREQDNI